MNFLFSFWYGLILFPSKRPNYCNKLVCRRVMEWLRHVDLSEYAPNLRGSGVHGALLVHERRFTAEILAGILSIPPSKTLLRRHLSLHIKVRLVS